VAPVANATPARAPAAGDNGPAKAPAPKPKTAKLHRIEHHDTGVLLRLTPVPSYVSQTLANPPRLVIDLNNTQKRSKGLAAPKSTAWAHKVRMGQQPDGLRVVFDLRQGRQATVEASPQGLWVRPHRVKTPPSTPQAVRDAPPTVLDGTTALQNVTLDNVVQGDKVLSRLFLQTDGQAEPKLDVTNEHAWVLEMANTTLPASLERAIDTSAQPGAVTLVSTFAAQRKPPKVHVVVNLAQAASQTLKRVPGGWLWQIETLPKAIQTQVAAPRVAAFVADAPAEKIVAVAPPVTATVPPPNRGSTKRISIDVKDADIINVLRLISEETGDNIIASDEVKGKVSLKLRGVPADQALDTMLRTKGFDKVRQNNILRVASAESIQKEREQDLARRKALAEVEDTFIKMVTINYATASEVVDQLKPLLSPRGSVQVDGRTNTLILQDVASNIDRLVELARRLDKQTPLVNIQARIVEAQSSYLRDLGVQWGGTTQHTSRTGNPTGVYFPGDIAVNGAADAGLTNQAQGVTTPSRYAVNLPATLAGQGGGLGFILGSAGGSHLLDLRLTAMESNGTGKIISSPEVSTLDNKTARVSQGVEIPVSVVSAAGTNVRFVPAVLELEVTPHVTNDGTVLLRIKVQKSQLDYTQKSAAGDPSIQKKQAETEVLVRDGDTSVIGGIYTRTTTDTYNEVPFLARIPLLGRLFREHRGEDNRSELLVFITPRIINRDESVVQTGGVLQGTKTAP
jgi:type IV pilus assembly protein PilQ